MGFNSPSSRLQYNATRFTGFAGIGGEGGVCSLLPIASASVSTTTLGVLGEAGLPNACASRRNSTRHCGIES